MERERGEEGRERRETRFRAERRDGWKLGPREREKAHSLRREK